MSDVMLVGRLATVQVWASLSMCGMSSLMCRTGM